MYAYHISDVFIHQINMITTNRIRIKKNSEKEIAILYNKVHNDNIIVSRVTI